MRFVFGPSPDCHEALWVFTIDVSDQVHCEVAAVEVSIMYDPYLFRSETSLNLLSEPIQSRTLRRETGLVP